MKTTVDKEGRVIIPAPVRRLMGLIPGSTLLISVVDSAIHLEPIAPHPNLVRVNGRLIARPVTAGELPPVDVAALVDQERHRVLN